jgi:branched-chain amino acid transport system substrate-binding protein
MVVALLVPVIGLAACQSTGASPGNGSTTIRIGLSASFSGATAFYGQEAKAGAELAVDELNAKGGKYKYQLVTADDQCTPDGGSSAFGNLLDVQQVDVILGSPCSAATLGGMTLLPAAKAPALTVSSTAPSITQQAGIGGNQYMWRMNINDDVMATVFSKYIAAQGIKKIAIIAVNSDFGQGAVAAYKKTFAADGVTITTTQFYTQGGGDFRTQLTNIGASGAQAMLIIGAYQDAAVMMRQFKELGLGVRVYARGDVVSTGFQQAAGNPDLGNGIQEADNWDSSYQAYPGFAQAFRQKFHSDPQSYAVQAWLGMQVIAQAVAAGGGGRAGIERGLATVNWSSPIGPVKFDAHHQAHHDMFIMTFDHGMIKMVERIHTAG